MNRSPSKYSFVEYSPHWPQAFAEEADRWRNLLGEELIAVHHIGSTSVVGLAAKPIIDLLPVVRELAKVDDIIARIEQHSYKAWGEYGIPGRRYFTQDQGEYRTHNIHLFQQGSPEITRHLAFCAYLRTHDEIRREYEALKRRVYTEHPEDISAYSQGKNDWIKRVEIVALEWFRSQGEAAAK